MINVTTQSRWEWFTLDEVPPYKIVGKYLFYGDRDALVAIARDALANHGFHKAKIPRLGYSGVPEYVLCLYYKDDSRKNEVAALYGNMPNVRFDRWKTDAETRADIFRRLGVDVSIPTDLKPNKRRRKKK